MNVPRYRYIAVALAASFCLPRAGAQVRSEGDSQVRVHLRTDRRHVNVGDPIPVEFAVRNTSDEPVTLFVPGVDPRVSGELAGLPLSHIFSGEAFSALTVSGEDGRVWNVAAGYQPPVSAPIVTLGPRATLGLTIDIRAYYSPLRTPGVFRIRWAPYGGFVESNTLVIQVAALKRAEIATDSGTMSVEFYYEDAPNHIDNFIELADKGFYNNLTFHRIESGFFVQGGCPSADGRGIRPDGVKLHAEFSDRPQSRGSVSMARLESDPDSASCQFIIANTRIPDWDGKYTIFGRLVGDESFKTLDRLMALPVDAHGRPLRKLFIRSVRIVDTPADAR